jgi:CheY-like chemotaxis protein
MGPGIDSAVSVQRLILIADADPVACRLYRTTLQATGFDTADAFDGRDALAKTFALRPFAIVLFPDLAFIDGVELCRLLRADASTAGIRVIVVTESAQDAKFARAWEAGADAVLDRPRALESLPDAVRRALTRGPAARLQKPTTNAPDGSSGRRSMLVRAHHRFTTTQPPIAPPSLVCPFCDGGLVYRHSHIGGVNAHNGEQWDYFVCENCGDFEFRQRTRHLRSLGRS